MARKATKVVLTDEQRSQLERIVCAGTSEQRLVKRARVALLAEKGLTNEEIGTLVGLSSHKVSKWRQRVAAEGVEGLADRPRAGGPRRYGHDHERAPDPELPHQPRDPLLADLDPVDELQLRVDPGRAVDPLRLEMDLTDPLGQPAVGELTGARRPALPGVVALTRHTDDPAQQGDGELCGLLLDEPEPGHGRSVSLAKKAAPRFRISRYCRSTLFSRSSSRSRCRSSLESTSSRSPRSAASWRHQLRNVCDVTP